MITKLGEDNSIELIKDIAGLCILTDLGILFLFNS